MNHPRSSDFNLADMPDELDLCRWVGSAAPGDVLEYYRGHLACDRSIHGRFGDTPQRRALTALANRALDLSDRGLVRLFQRRYGPHDYAYYAVASSARQSGRQSRARASPQGSVAGPPGARNGPGSPRTDDRIHLTATRNHEWSLT